MNKTKDILTAQETLSLSTQTSVLDCNNHCNITIKPSLKRLHREITSQRYPHTFISVKQKKTCKRCLHDNKITNDNQTECNGNTENSPRKYLTMYFTNIGKKRILSTEEIILEDCKRNQFKAKPLHANVFSSSNAENEMKSIEYKKKNRNYSKNNKGSNVDKDNKGSKHKSFTPSPLPSFTFLEMKKSDRPLTIAHSPCLKTKLRYIKRKQIKNTNTNTINITPIATKNSTNKVAISQFHI